MLDRVRLEDIVIMLMAYQLTRQWWRLNRRWVKGWWKRAKDHRPMKRHPKTPQDCPYCYRGLHLETAHINREVRPWSEVKSRRGRKKTYSTQGRACLNPKCPYYGITDETIHALIQHTMRGKHQDIPYLRCQCCHTVFTSRKGTPLYYLKTKADRVEMVLWFW
jgi:hypothetical protein